ncbi:MAG: 3-oxoacyl-[acyl-carrier protein] reductase, partial [uncultured Rubrobacteraceae bacterium]
GSLWEGGAGYGGFAGDRARDLVRARREGRADSCPLPRRPRGGAGDARFAGRRAPRGLRGRRGRRRGRAGPRRGRRARDGRDRRARQQRGHLRGPPRPRGGLRGLAGRLVPDDRHQPHRPGEPVLFGRPDHDGRWRRARGERLLARGVPRGARDTGLRREQGRPERHEPVHGPGARTPRRLLLRRRARFRRDRDGERPAAWSRGRRDPVPEPPRARRHPRGGRAHGGVSGLRSPGLYDRRHRRRERGLLPQVL